MTLYILFQLLILVYYHCRKFFNEVLNLYLKAVQRFADSDNADADVQNGLGVLLTLNSDYEKALDCFETAVRIHPNVSTQNVVMIVMSLKLSY